MITPLADGLIPPTELKLAPDPFLDHNPIARSYASREHRFIGWSKRPAELPPEPRIFARDGLRSLLWFFENHPQPGKFRRRLFVHRNLLAYVPPLWRAQTGSYRLALRHPTSPLDLREIVFLGLLTSKYCSDSVFELCLQRLKSTLGRDTLKAAKISLCLIYLDHGFGHVTETFFIRRVLKLNQYMGSEIDPVSWHMIERRNKNFADTLLVDLNDNSLCASPYPIHSLCSRGARTPFYEERQEGEREHWISEHHGLFLCEEPLYPKEDPELSGRYLELRNYFRSLQSHMAFRAPPRLPWPAWLESSCESLLRHSAVHNYA